MEDVGNKGEHNKLNKYASACAIIASTISIIFGYDTGVMNGATIFIKEDLEISDPKIGILNGVLNLCALIGSLTAGRTSDYIGRRYTIILASTLFLLGSILMGCSFSYSLLLTGRCIAGLGVGFALMIVPIYTSEISSAKHRGKLSSLPEFCISLGILLGYVSNYLFGKLKLKLGWRLMLSIASIPSLCLIFGVLKMPESPRWLVMKGRVEEARNVLNLVANSENEAETRLEEIRITVKANASLDQKSQDEISLWKEVLFRPSPMVRWALFAAVGLHFFEHATGVEALVLYSPRIFEVVGVADKNKLLLANIGLGVTKTSFILVAIFLLDRVGRRPLLLTSAAGATGALIALGVGLTVVERSTERVPWALALSIGATFIYMGFFSIGISPITWVYTCEIFPLRFRGVGVGIAVAVNRSMNAAVSMSFLSISKAITVGGSFLMFGGFGVLAWWFFYLCLVETKGRSLEEIEVMFTKKDDLASNYAFVESVNKK